MNYEIKHKTTCAVLFAGEGTSLREVVERAVRERADLHCANLRGADLSVANLHCANLSGASLYGADLSGADLTGAIVGKNLRLLGRRPVLMIGPIGSRSDYCTIYLTEKGVYVNAGCFFGALDAFAAAVNETHGDNAHGREYCALIDLARVHAECWTPDVEGK